MSNQHYTWTVIGAGPAGIAAVGQLIDHGVAAKEILWIDPHFHVGDFGSKWLKVPSNTKVKLFTQFLNAVQAFEYDKCPEKFSLHEQDPDVTCELNLMAQPLQWVTNQLRQKVTSLTDFVTEMSLNKRIWHLSLQNSKIQSKNVIMATGSEPKTLSHSHLETVDLSIAFDREKLAAKCGADDTVAVFGSSHSAILIIRNLLEACSVKNVVNVYQSPLRYAVYLENEILFDDTGLKGTTAEWAREHIDGVLPKKLFRVLANDLHVEKHLDTCNKAIYAVGFKRRHIEIEGMSELTYDDKTGIIAPGLFGFGIAFPEAKLDRFGNLEYRVGLWKFMDYLKRIMPVWLQYST